MSKLKIALVLALLVAAGLFFLRRRQTSKGGTKVLSCRNFPVRIAPQ